MLTRRATQTGSVYVFDLFALLRRAPLPLLWPSVKVDATALLWSRSGAVQPFWCLAFLHMCPRLADSQGAGNSTRRSVSSVMHGLPSHQTFPQQTWNHLKLNQGREIWCQCWPLLAARRVLPKLSFLSPALSAAVLCQVDSDLRAQLFLSLLYLFPHNKTLFLRKKSIRPFNLFCLDIPLLPVKCGDCL